MKVSDLGPSGGGGGGGTVLQLYAGALPGADGSAPLGSGPTSAGYVVDYRAEIVGGYGPGSTLELTAGATSLLLVSAEQPILLSGPAWLAVGVVPIVATIAGATLAGSGSAGVIAS